MIAVKSAACTTPLSVFGCLSDILDVRFNGSMMLFMNLSKVALLFVIFVDVAGQGLIFPLINSLVSDPAVGFMPAGTSEATRHLSYGLVIGVFYLSWFLGAVYISKLSDSIGRKNGIMVCLAGALAGYVLTILAIALGSLWLMILGRAITGFTAGNQPIAQAALVDHSRDEAEKTRNLGYAVSAFSIGLIAGPLIAGLLSDTSLIGNIASLSLPFYVAFVLVLITMFLVVVFFDDKLDDRVPLQIRPLEIFLLLWQVRRHPVVLRLAAVFFCYMFVWNTFYVFIDAFLTSRFQLGTLGTSLAMLVLGATVALSSAILVASFNARFSRHVIIRGAATIMALASVLFIVSPSEFVVFVALVPLAAAFAVGYATFLSLFSASVDASQQGWVMGVTTALWTLGAGLTSLIVGELMGRDIDVPFFVAIAFSVLALVLIAILWRFPDVRRIARKVSGTPN